jgi:hypothetical protein
MKIKQVVNADYNYAYCSYTGVEFTDSNGNDITITMSHDQYLDLEQKIVSKCDSIRKQREDEMAEKIAAQQNEDADE